MADQKISGLTDGTSPEDADEFVAARGSSNVRLLWSQLSSAIGGAVSSVFGRTGDVTAEAGDYTADQVGALADTADLSLIATANPTLESVAMNSQKLTGLAAGTTNGDSVRFEQIPTSLPPDGSAGGDLMGTYPNPTVAAGAITEAKQTLADNTTGDVSTSAHGYAPKAPNDATKYLDGTGAYSVPAGSGGNGDGWVDDTAETWTYASSSSFKVSGTDVTSKYTPGTRIRCKQGGSYLYFVVVSSAFSTDTTVTITGGSDYTLANTTITDNYHSYAANPQGYPGWFNYSLTGATGFTGAITTVQARFAVNGRVCTISIDFNGTSNASTCTVPAPVACVSRVLVLAVLLDNGVAVEGRADLPASSSTITLGKAVGLAGGFTSSGSKGAFLYFSYDI